VSERASASFHRLSREAVTRGIEDRICRLNAPLMDAGISPPEGSITKCFLANDQSSEIN